MCVYVIAYDLRLSDMKHLHYKKIKRQKPEKSFEMSTEERDLENLEGIFVYFYYRKRQKEKVKKRKHDFWIRSIYKQRSQFGVFTTWYQELKLDREYYYRFLRMSPERFDHLLSLVGERIAKKDTRFRKSISSEERLVY